MLQKVSLIVIVIMLALSGFAIPLFEDLAVKREASISFWKNGDRESDSAGPLIPAAEVPACTGAQPDLLPCRSGRGDTIEVLCLGDTIHITVVIIGQPPTTSSTVDLINACSRSNREGATTDTRISSQLTYSL